MSRLVLDGVSKTHGRRRRAGGVRALDAVSLSVDGGEIVGVVGESGSGKSTLAHIAAGLIAADDGAVHVEGASEQVQLVFQDPLAALDPRMTAGASIAEGLEIQGLAAGARVERVRALLARCGLPPEVADARPQTLSGGQRQRVCIARALAVEPAVLIADEPVSALDASVAGQVLNLLRELADTLDLAVLLIGHDLGGVGAIADRFVVLYAGRVVEVLPNLEVAKHPYTQALVACTLLLDPTPDAPLTQIGGEPPSGLAPLPGCAFAPRCAVAEPRCTAERPELVSFEDGHAAACYVAHSSK